MVQYSTLLYSTLLYSTLLDSTKDTGSEHYLISMASTNASLSPPGIRQIGRVRSDHAPLPLTSSHPSIISLLSFLSFTTTITTTTTKPPPRCFQSPLPSILMACESSLHHYHVSIKPGGDPTSLLFFFSFLFFSSSFNCTNRPSLYWVTRSVRARQNRPFSPTAPRVMPQRSPKKPSVVL
ncbi:hypothetical protein BCV70DRAFT_95921 [Testicularia cyperi]|uniref:Uncharacterized protein n=1 Tax=Testicularia cyperi TaxID=1882483 RepID=A0A317XQT0_9BASI|nr:hypothetical protein BCV70DRAFT_95921 [Testicularia cyperi]